MTQPPANPLPEVLERAFAPLHKLAMGLSVGLTTGLLVFVATVFHVIVQPVDGPRIGLLSQYFYGYDVTWLGAVVGLWWGFVAGFAGGWFVTFLRNLLQAMWIFTTRTRAELAQSSDFLDHI
jgi:hypothetical protein